MSASRAERNEQLDEFDGRKPCLHAILATAIDTITTINDDPEVGASFLQGIGLRRI